MKKHNNCYCCGESSLNAIYNNNLFRCIQCGHTIAAEKYFDFDFDTLYSEKYFKGEEYLDYLSDRQAIQRNFDKRLNHLHRIFPTRKPEFVLEIGAAYGFFANSLQNIFPKANYLGFEISAEPVLWAQQQLNIDIRNEDYLASQLPTQSFSDVFMWDVIEHLPDPALFLEKAYSEMTDGGHIHITTGDIGRILPKIQGHRWRMIHPPTHLHYFTRHSLTLLLESKGFKVIYVTYPAIYRSIRQIWYSLFSLNKKRQKNRVHKHPERNRFVGLNTYDIMFVVAEKTPVILHQ